MRLGRLPLGEVAGGAPRPARTLAVGCATSPPASGPHHHRPLRCAALPSAAVDVAGAPLPLPGLGLALAQAASARPVGVPRPLLGAREGRQAGGAPRKGPSSAVRFGPGDLGATATSSSLAVRGTTLGGGGAGRLARPAGAGTDSGWGAGLAELGRCGAAAPRTSASGCLGAVLGGIDPVARGPALEHCDAAAARRRSLGRGRDSASSPPLWMRHRLEHAVVTGLRRAPEAAQQQRAGLVRVGRAAGRHGCRSRGAASQDSLSWPGYAGLGGRFSRDLRRLGSELRFTR